MSDPPTDDTTTITGDPDDVEVPDDADYYYCPECEWTGDYAPVNDELFPDCAGEPLVQCRNCGHKPIYVAINREGHVPDPGFPERTEDDA